jgi:hypothetical protein
MRTLIIAILALIFHAGAAHSQNQPPIMPHEPGPADGATQIAFNTWLAWESGDPESCGLKFDVYWGTDPDPPVVAIDVDVNPYNCTTGWQFPGFGEYSTTYYWRIVARDPQGGVTVGPTWSYTVKAVNEPPLIPEVYSPADGATGNPINVTLRYIVQDFEWSPLNIDVYFGTDPNPPLVADHLVPLGDYKPGVLIPSTLYYWRVVARDPQGLETSGPVWTFTTANTPNQIPDTPSNPYPAYANNDGPNPILRWDGTDPEGEELTFYIYFSDLYPVPKRPLPLIGTTHENQFQVGPLTNGKRYYWYVEVKDAEWTVKGPQWQFDNGPVPVLFTRFEASQAGENVDVRWLLSSDEAMESYALFRREGATGSPVVIASAAVQGVEGSYLDTSVEPAKTYYYELLVRTSDGDEFRSPVATVATAGLRLALHQNVPNPFNPQTTIRYELPAPAHVRLSIVDVSGRRVRTLVDSPQSAGVRESVWNGRDDHGNAVASGVYFYVLDAGKQRLTRKLVLLK